MYEIIVGEIQQEAKRLATVQRSSIDAIQGLKDETGKTFDVSLPIPESERTISDLDTLASSLVKFSEGFNADKNWAFTPRPWITQFRDALKNTANSFDNLVGQVNSVDAQHGGLASIDVSNFAIATKSGTAVELRKVLNNIAVNLDAGFSAYFQLRSATSAPRLTEFSELFSIFSTRRTELDTLSRELSSLAKQGRDSHLTLANFAKEGKKAQDEILKIKDTATKEKAAANEAAAEVAQKLETIRGVTKTAEELSAAVNAYSGTFTQFQAQLDDRTKTFESQKKQFESIVQQIKGSTDAVKVLTQQAEDMLKGSTNAGLAGSYSQKQNSTDSELKKARYAYYFSIGLLVFLTLPIFIYSFPREFVIELFKLIFGVQPPQLLVKPDAISDYDKLINTLGRAALLIPAYLFVRFASARHRELFRLREDYAYKYSIASSVDGFMKQSKAYADDIAAACYWELTHNPAHGMDHKSDDARMTNPVLERILAKLESRMVKKPPAKAAAPQGAA